MGSHEVGAYIRGFPLEAASASYVFTLIEVYGNHRASDFPFDLAETRGWSPSPDGISELWWASEAARAGALASPAAAEASALLASDETAFVHAPLTSAFLSTEHHI